MGTEDQVLLQHSQNLLERIKATVSMKTNQLKKVSRQYDSVYFCNVSNYVS